MARSWLGIRIGALPVHLPAAALAAALICAPHAVAADAAPSRAGLDCNHAQGLLETTICGDPDLIAQQRTMERLYAAVRIDALGVGPSAEPAEQAKWQADRDAQCAAKVAGEIKACLRQEFDARLAALAVSALIRAPELALAELRRQFPEQAPLYEALWRMATMPAGAARTDAVAALIGPAFKTVQSARYAPDDPVHGGGPAPVAMLGQIRTAHDAAATVESFDRFINIAGQVDPLGAEYIPCEAIVRQPQLIDAVGASYGARLFDGLGESDCDVELPSPPQFAAFAQLAIDAATPHCTAARRAVAVPAYRRFLLLVQLHRESAPPPPAPSVARAAAAFTAAHAAQGSAAEADLTAYYTTELHVADAAGAAHAGIGQLVDEAFAACS
jgi:uncharacterized protein